MSISSTASDYLSKGQGVHAPSVASSSRNASTILELIAEQTFTHKEALAVAASDCSLTYSQLDNYSNRLAQRLSSMGIRPDLPVGLCCERSTAFIVGALGILKAGGCYVPLDPEHPTDRLTFMLEDASVSVLATTSQIAKGLQLTDKQISIINIENLGTEDEKFEPILSHIDADHLAYIMYTSGSTGQPKGVQITHRSLMNLVSWHRSAFKISHTDRASQLASPSFDAAVWEIWPYLSAGASLHIPDEATRKDSKALRDWLVTKRISISFVPTPLAEQMIHLQWPTQTVLRFLLTGGDTLHRPPDPGLPFTVINNYGPTEATVVATSGPVDPSQNQDNVPTIGRPIANTKVHILDENMQPVSEGTTGELYIGGIGVAKGYVNRTDLTKERFVPDPFTSEANARLYKTGDLARSLPNGEIAFCGRIDGQIKLRGYRIEPDEIVAMLDRHPAVQTSAVGVYENSLGEKQLAAYVVMADSGKVTGHIFREFLHSKLPKYMIPSLFVQIKTMPMLSSGKLDRNALPVPTPANILREEARLPHTKVERQLISVLTGLLGIEKISIDDDFFMLGGHSLMGAQLLNKVRETFGVEITLMKIFENGTIAAMAAEIERLSSKTNVGAVGDTSWSAPART